MPSRGAAVKVLSDLVAANTVNPPGNESAAATVVARFFETLSIPFDLYEKTPGRANIIGRIGSGSPILLVASHLDTVPAGDGWTSDPFTLRVEGNLAYGRGANDNKGPLAASMLAAKALVESATPLDGTLLIAGIADEERGNEFGAKYLLDECSLAADFAVVPDCGGHMQAIDVAEKGVVFVEILARGCAAHGSRPEEGANAVVALARLVASLSDEPFPSPPHPHFSPMTMNVGSFSGGDAVNVVPDFARARIDFRTLPPITAADVLNFVRARAADIAPRFPGISFEARIVMSMPPHDLPLDSPLVSAAQRVSRRLFGRDMTPLYQGGVTLAKEFILAGIPSVGLGPGAFEAAHTVDEWIELDEVARFADFLFEIAKELLPAP